MKKFFIALLLLVSLTACTPYVDASKITYIEIDGMPCIFYDAYKQAGLSCNWEQWDGTKELKVIQ